MFDLPKMILLPLKLLRPVWWLPSALFRLLSCPMCVSVEQPCSRDSVCTEKNKPDSVFLV